MARILILGHVAEERSLVGLMGDLDDHAVVPVDRAPDLDRELRGEVDLVLVDGDAEQPPPLAVIRRIRSARTELPILVTVTEAGRFSGMDKHRPRLRELPRPLDMTGVRDALRRALRPPRRREAERAVAALDLAGALEESTEDLPRIVREAVRTRPGRSFGERFQDLRSTWKELLAGEVWPEDRVRRLQEAGTSLAGSAESPNESQAADELASRLASMAPDGGFPPRLVTHWVDQAFVALDHAMRGGPPSPRRTPIMAPGARVGRPARRSSTAPIDCLRRDAIAAAYRESRRNETVPLKRDLLPDDSSPPALVTLRDGPRAFVGQGHFLSADGLFIETSDDLPVGTELELELELWDGGALIRTRGHVLEGSQALETGRTIRGLRIRFPDPVPQLDARPGARRPTKAVGDETAGAVPPDLPALGGRFEILSHIGSGATAHVYRARDLSLDEVVAVKVLHREMAESVDVRSRFHREVRLARGIPSIHVALVHDVGLVENRPYLVMECLDGETVEGFLDRTGCIPVPRALEIIADALQGLAAGHACGIVHRDVKPSNLFVTADMTKVLDFGLALGLEDTRITEIGTILGTPCYLSPEAIRGEELDVRSDLYSVGCTLFHMLIGDPPYEGENLIATTVMHLEDPIPDVRAIDPSIPPDLAEILVRCLRKEPGERYRDAEHLLEAIEGVQQRLAGVERSQERRPPLRPRA